MWKTLKVTVNVISESIFFQSRICIVICNNIEKIIMWSLSENLKTIDINSVSYYLNIKNIHSYMD